MVLLPTLLHGFVPAVHTAILMIVDALRRLDGQVVSISEARHLRVEPGSRVLDKGSTPHLREALIRGFVLLEGSFPVATINPAVHHFAHYGGQTGFAGILRWFAMWGFERNNKRIKAMCRSFRYTLAGLAKCVQMDIATRINMIKQTDFLSARMLSCGCQFSRLSKDRGSYVLTRREKIDLARLGVSTFNDVQAFEIARVLGVHFRAGEWGRLRCGSVITTIFDRRSRYCYVKKFLKVDGKCFARVVWLSVPTYPYAPNRLIVSVRMLSDAQQNAHHPFVSVEKIDPCAVAVLPQRDGTHFWMMREKGHDRVPSDF